MPPKLMDKSSPMSTRSTSSSTVSSVTSKPSTIDDVLLAIDDLRKVQMDIKTDNKKLAAALKRGLDDLTSRIDNLMSDISVLNTKVNALDNRILALESTTQSPLSSLSISDVLSELAERDKCKSNIIIHGLPESPLTDYALKFNEDMKNVNAVFSQLSLVNPVDFKLIRLGKTTSTSSRPIKVIFNNSIAANQVLSSFHALQKHSPESIIGVKFVRDKTLLEREKLRLCHQELTRRTKEGETDLTITYQNGLPCVLKRRSKNSNPVRHLIRK